MRRPLAAGSWCLLLLGGCRGAPPPPTARPASQAVATNARLHAIGRQLVSGAIDSATQLADQDAAVGGDPRFGFWRLLSGAWRPRDVLTFPDTIALRPLLGLWGVDVAVPRAAPERGDTTLTWVFDTGSNVTVVSEGTARAVRHRALPAQVGVGSFTGGELRAAVIVLDSLRVGRALLTDVPAVVLPDSALRMAAGILRISGILGMPELGRFSRGHALIVDVHRRTVRTATGSGAGVPVPLRFEYTKPFVEATVETVAGECHLDTGARLTTLSPRWWAQLSATQRARSVAVRSTVSGVGGVRDVEVRRFPTVAIQVGPASIMLADREAPMGRTAGSLERALCNLGLDALLQLDSLAIDAGRSEVVAWPRRARTP